MVHALPQHLRNTAFTPADARNFDVPASRLRRADLARPFYGVRLDGARPRDIRERCRAYLPRLGPSAYFSHETAGMLHGIPLPKPDAPADTAAHAGAEGDPDAAAEGDGGGDAGAADAARALHVTSFAGGDGPRTAGVIGHSTSAARPAIVFIEELPVSSPARTWCELAATLSREDLVAAGDYLISGVRLRRGSGRMPPLCTLDELRAAAREHGSRRGARGIAWALPRLRTGVDSRPESRLRLLLVASRLPEPEIGIGVRVPGGRMLHPDLAYPALRLAFEYEGDEHRTNARRFRDDIRRREALEAAGWRVVRVVSDDVFEDTDDFIARVRAVLAARIRELDAARPV
ncbi:DUF559 domain-containing protein [Streptomyces sp. ISL-90]|nr:DUF559 domain-containing protein [Streptomyces sp. ISL-90]